MDTLVLELVVDAAAWLWPVYLVAASLAVVGLTAWLFLSAVARAARLASGAARCLAEPGLLLMEAAAAEAAGRMGASAAVPAALWWFARLHAARRTFGPQHLPIPDTRAGRAWIEASRELKETTAAILGALLLVVMALLSRRLWAAAGAAAVLAALLWRWPGSEQRERWARVRLSLDLSDRHHDSVVVASWAASPWLVGAMRCLCGERRTVGRERLTGTTGAPADEPHNGWGLKAKRWTAATRLQRLWRSTYSKRLGQELRKVVTEARARPPESATTGWAKMRWRQAMQPRTDHAMKTLRARAARSVPVRLEQIEGQARLRRRHPLGGAGPPAPQASGRGVATAPRPRRRPGVGAAAGPLGGGRRLPLGAGCFGSSRSRRLARRGKSDNDGTTSW